MIRLVALLSLVAASGHCDVLIANRAIPSRSIIAAEDVSVAAQSVQGTYTTPEEVIGREARVTLYPGRPIRRGDVGAPAVVERNQVVPLRYATGGLFIETEGRALARAGVGDLIRVMNITSRTTVTGRVAPDGTIEVGK
ncbi:flagellar basal body P-ring formation chaperone FlgA [Algicella marina]|uniref:Flagella basal body P-ring formation protein FlgA n=1 Tax=Algicella marina TaxID=2683284 RepID=A0A6P1T3W1_9RHOB|nr:flagellar basal body P-ring formation chaperone FlgA [Algicella marina]QHQ36451.1 flagellar basal body P-ring formation protein FlgA [Algicella marina]